MSRTLQFSDDARDHLDSISDFIEVRAGARVADAFFDAVTLKCEKMASLPGTLGTARPDLRHDIRSTPYKSYIIYFRYMDDCLEVIGVLNAHRDAAAFFADDSSEP